jgi:hypothetical protein
VVERHDREQSLARLKIQPRDEALRRQHIAAMRVHDPFGKAGGARCVDHDGGVRGLRLSEGRCACATRKTRDALDDAFNCAGFDAELAQRQVHRVRARNRCERASALRIRLLADDHVSAGVPQQEAELLVRRSGIEWNEQSSQPRDGQEQQHAQVAVRRDQCEACAGDEAAMRQHACKPCARFLELAEAPVPLADDQDCLSGRDRATRAKQRSDRLGVRRIQREDLRRRELRAHSALRSRKS